jgi:biopolymer transport protein ExbB
MKPSAFLKGCAVTHRLRFAMTALLAGFPASAWAQGTPAVTGNILPDDLSVRAMFSHADIIVQAVMIGLMFASVVTWTILIAKTIELVAARRALHRAMHGAEQDRTLAARRKRLGKETGPGGAFTEAATAEIVMSQGSDPAGTKERIASRLHRIEANMVRRATKGTGLLATIGSTAPFVGLFGTVWGIMNSFIGISQAHTTNLAVVAPGIAEALLATATGLVAAIPAVVTYNVFARATGGYRAELATLSALVQRLASRELDLPRALRAEAA